MLSSEPNKLFLIAGPCVIENDQVPFEIAEKVKKICNQLDIDFIFKASFQKANRTRHNSFTGIDELKALEIIHEVGKVNKIRTLTDVHESKDPERVAFYVDILQIPAFLCRQTNLLLAAGNTGKTVNIKKGQFMSPQSMQFPLEKVRSTGNEKVWLCERGFTMGYEDLVVDATAITQLKKHGVPVVMDCTHSLQRPNQASGVTGGNPEMIETVARSAIATGADGLFIETHPNPETALSDGASMLSLEMLEPLLKTIIKIRKALYE
jgi:2-dehydro-3-deoxyphosphooctonate aldolase (KDO 8-P synthase)